MYPTKLRHVSTAERWFLNYTQSQNAETIKRLTDNTSLRNHLLRNQHQSSREQRLLLLKVLCLQSCQRSLVCRRSVTRFSSQTAFKNPHCRQCCLLRKLLLQLMKGQSWMVLQADYNTNPLQVFGRLSTRLLISGMIRYHLHQLRQPAQVCSEVPVGAPVS